MLQLFEFIGRNRNFILFVLLEVLSFSLLVNNNNYWSVNYFNTASTVASKSLKLSNSVKEYSNLQEINTLLAQENRRLNEQLAYLQQNKPANAPAGYKADSIFSTRYKFVTVAKVIGNSTLRSDNYITIDKGTADGVRERMGVLSPTGIVGIVKSCNDNSCIITSLLHSRFTVGAKLVRSSELGTIAWLSTNPAVVSLKDISRYKKVIKGDTAVTSDYSSVFPPGQTIGRVSKIAVSADQSQFDIELQLSTDFTKLSYVYLVENKLQKQQESLQKSPIEPPK